MGENNNEADLKLTVGAEAQKGSGTKAAKDLSKEIYAVVDDGHITIPVELKTPIKGASKELLTLQKDVIDQWEKTFKKGYSDSAEDMNKLTTLWRNFKRELGKERKTSAKPAQRMTDFMGSTIQQYNNKRQTTQSKRNEQVKNNQKISNKQNKKADNKTITQKDIDRAKEIIKEQNENRRENKQFTKDLERPKSSRKATGLRTPSWDSTYFGYTDDKGHPVRLEKNDKSGTWWGRSQLMNESGRYEYSPENRKRVKKSTKVYTDPKQAEETFNSRKVTEKLNNPSYMKQGEKIFHSQLLNEAAKIQGGMLHDREGDDLSKEIQQISDIWMNGKIKGIDDDKIIDSIKNILQNRHTDNGMIGITDGTPKGVVKDEEHTNKIEKSIMDKVTELVHLTPEDLKKAIGTGATPADPNEKKPKSIYKRLKKELENDNTFGITAKDLATLLSNTIPSISQVKTELANATKPLNETAEKKANDIQGDLNAQARNDRIEDRREAVADSKLEDTAKTDAETGSNSDTNFDELLSKEDLLNDSVQAVAYSKNKDNNAAEMAKQTSKILSGKGQKGADGDCPCETILRGMYVVLRTINTSVSKIANKGIKAIRR